jgi:hypothetical protein
VSAISKDTLSSASIVTYFCSISCQPCYASFYPDPLLYPYDPVTHLVRQFACLHTIQAVIETLADIAYNFIIDDVVFALVVQDSNR